MSSSSPSNKQQQNTTGSAIGGGGRPSSTKKEFSSTLFFLSDEGDASDGRNTGDKSYTPRNYDISRRNQNRQTPTSPKATFSKGAGLSNDPHSAFQRVAQSPDNSQLKSSTRRAEASARSSTSSTSKPASFQREPEHIATSSSSPIVSQHRSKIPKFSSAAAARNFRIDTRSPRATVRPEERETIGTMAAQSSKQSPPSARLSTSPSKPIAANPVLAAPTKIPSPTKTTNRKKSSFSAYKPAVENSASLFLDQPLSELHSPPTPNTTSSIFRRANAEAASMDQSTRPPSSPKSQSSTGRQRKDSDSGPKSNVTKLFQPTIPFVKYDGAGTSLTASSTSTGTEKANFNSHSQPSYDDGMSTPGFLKSIQQPSLSSEDDASVTLNTPPGHMASAPISLSRASSSRSVSSDKPVAQNYLKSIQQPSLSSASSSSDPWSGMEESSEHHSDPLAMTRTRDASYARNASGNRQIGLFQTPEFQTALQDVRNREHQVNDPHVDLDSVARVPSDEVLFSAPSPVFFEEDPKPAPTVGILNQKKAIEDSNLKTFDGDDSMLETESVEVSLPDTPAQDPPVAPVDEPGKIISRLRSLGFSIPGITTEEQSKQIATSKPIRRDKTLPETKLSMSGSFLSESSERGAPAVFEDKSDSNVDSDGEEDILLPGSPDKTPSWAKIMQEHSTFDSAEGFESYSATGDGSNKTRTSMTIVQQGAQILEDIDPRVAPPKIPHSQLKHTQERQDSPLETGNTAVNAGPRTDVEQGRIEVVGRNGDLADSQVEQDGHDNKLDCASFSVTQKVLLLSMVSLAFFLILFGAIRLSRDG